MKKTMNGNKPDDRASKQVDAGGGIQVEGSVYTGGGDFVGHDKIIHGDEIRGDKVVYTRSNLEELNDCLAHAVAAYEARLYQVMLRQAPPVYPYRFLYAFNLEDAPIFFGRDIATEELYAKVLSNRLTVLHARSGAGKTSLLNAGLSPRLIRAGRLPIYARTYKDPVSAIKRAIVPPSFGPWPELLPNLSLQEFLGLACDQLSDQTQELVIMLDQFEQFFFFYAERERRQISIEALGNCYDDTTLPIRFVIAIRGECLTDLADFQRRLPDIFHNHYRLDTMSRAEAIMAITGPVAQLNQNVIYEPVLLDTLLNDLARGGMELPHLQIICTQLYDAVPLGQTTITLASYDKMGRAEGMLSSYLADVLRNKFPGTPGTVAKEALKELVSSEATRRVLSRESLVARIKQKTGMANVEEAELEEVLAQLVDARLLREDDESGILKYEMAHDYLAEKIKGWLDREELEVKRAEELLEREIANWRVSGTLMNIDHLDVIAGQSVNLELGSEAQDFLLCSASACAHEVAYWWVQHTDPAKATELVTSLLLGANRERARELADTLWPEGEPPNEALDRLVEEVVGQLNSEDTQQRQRAREIQVFIGPSAEQTIRGHLQSFWTGLRLLVPDRWSTILTMALGGALGGSIGGTIQTFLGRRMGFVPSGSGFLPLLRSIVILGPTMAIFGALVGTGLRIGTILARGRGLLFEVIGAACGSAIGGFLIPFYLVLLGAAESSESVLQTLFNLTLSSSALAAAIILGMRVTDKWNIGWDRTGKKVIKQISGAVLAAGIIGIVKDILEGTFPAWTLLAVFLGTCFAIGLSLAEYRLLASNKQI
jgi:hypothetical protein